MIPIHGHGQTERHPADDAAGNQAGSMRNVPGNAEFFSQNVRGSSWQQCHGDLASRETVDHFVDRSVAPADNHHAAPLLDGLRAIFVAEARAVVGAVRSRSRILQNPHSLFHLGEAAMAFLPAGGVVNQKRVLDSVQAWRSVWKFCMKTHCIILGSFDRRYPAAEGSMSRKQDAVKEIERLREEIRRHEYFYYVADDPEISDVAFDRLMKQLQQLEDQHPSSAHVGFAHTAGGRGSTRRFSGRSSQNPDGQPRQCIFLRGSR